MLYQTFNLLVNMVQKKNVKHLLAISILISGLLNCVCYCCTQQVHFLVCMTQSKLRN